VAVMVSVDDVWAKQLFCRKPMQHARTSATVIYLILNQSPLHYRLSTTNSHDVGDLRRRCVEHAMCAPPTLNDLCV
jgi:hypothetical protein